MFIASRLLLVLGLIGAAVGLFFGAKGALLAHDAVSEANRKGGDAESLFRADRLEGALDKVRAKIGADGALLELAVYPGYLMAEASTGSEDEGQAFKVQASGNVTKIPLTLTGPGRLEDNTFAFAGIDGKTVERVATAVAAKERATLDDVSHVIATIDPVSGKPGLNVYLKNSKYWRAALDGSGLSNPDQDARNAVDKAAATIGSAGSPATGSVKPADDLAACVQAAGTDASKIQACTS